MMNETGNDHYLLTPGPLTTSLATKQAMLRDWGSRDPRFSALTKRIRQRLLTLVDASETHVCIPMQGSGTFAVEAALGTLIPRQGKVLVLVNGAYGRRIVSILQILGRETIVHETTEDTPCDVVRLGAALEADKDISHVAVIHCETTSGLLNPIKKVSDTVKRCGRRLLIDAMSAFGAIPLSAADIQFDAVMASSNKCLEGAPGFGFVIARQTSLVESEGNSHSLALDLYAQWRCFEKNGQWRFTPPTHVVAAFDQALEEYLSQGGLEARAARYRENYGILVGAMETLGFEMYLDPEIQAPIIATFHTPADPNFDFATFYDALAEEGFLIYPGKITSVDTFRIGCIGQLYPAQMNEAVRVITEVLHTMGVSNCHAQER